MRRSCCWIRCPQDRGLPTDTGQLNRPPDRLGRKRGQTLNPNTGSGRRQHLGASPSFRGRLAVLMAQGESGYWPGSGAALADRIQETLTLLRLMCKRAFEKITTIRFQITADSMPFTILQIRMTTRRSSGSGPNRYRRSRRVPKTRTGRTNGNLLPRSEAKPEDAGKGRCVSGSGNTVAMVITDEGPVEFHPDRG